MSTNSSTIPATTRIAALSTSSGPGSTASSEGVALPRSFASLARWPALALLALDLALLAFVGVADLATGYNLSFQIFYLLPVSLAAWLLGARAAVAFSIGSVAVWLIGDWVAGARYPNSLVLAWNATIILAFYLVVVWLLRRLRESLLGLEHRVRERTAALRAEMAERERLEKEVLAIAEREQRRIGHDLHDGLGQHLTGTAMAAQVLTDRLAELGLDPEAADAARIVSLTDQAIELTRGLSRGLSPVALLDAENFTDPFRELAAQTAAHHRVSCRFDAPAGLRLTEQVAATHLYRIAQEALGNALRHAGARRVDMTLDQQDGRLTLTVTDDGCGLPPLAARRPGGMGLRIMAHRASMIGADFEVRPRETGGTVVRCSLPEFPGHDDA